MPSKIFLEEGVVVVQGGIKSFSNVESFKDCVNQVVENGVKNIVIRLEGPDCSITSSVIGFLLKKVKVEKNSVRLEIQSQNIYTILENLNLQTSLELVKI